MSEDTLSHVERVRLEALKEASHLVGLASTFGGVGPSADDVFVMADRIARWLTRDSECPVPVDPTPEVFACWCGDDLTPDGHWHDPMHCSPLPRRQQDIPEPDPRPSRPCSCGLDTVSAHEYDPALNGCPFQGPVWPRVTPTMERSVACDCRQSTVRARPHVFDTEKGCPRTPVPLSGAGRA